MAPERRVLDGLGGEDPPYHYPVFVLTHHAREPVEMQGGTTDAAGGKDVMLWRGAQAANRYSAAGLLDELELHVVPLWG